MFKLHRSRTGKLPAVAALIMVISLTGFITPELGKSSAPTGIGDDYRISVDVGLVVLPVIVTDGKGKAVSGLGQENFQVFDDGRPQEISLFEAEDVPVTVGLVIDNSGSMRARRPEVVAAAQEFAKSSNPQDHMFVVNFNHTVSLGLPQNVPFTSNVDALRAAVSAIPAAGNTALYDGLAVALDHLKTGTANRKALIVISDGGDNASKLSLSQVLRRARASNAEIFTIGVLDDRFAGDNAGVLRRLARVSGGKSYFPASTSQITAICHQVAQDLRHQYTLGYHPSSPNAAGSFHAIRVTVKATGDGRLHVSTRAGYLMPSEAQTVSSAETRAFL